MFWPECPWKEKAASENGSYWPCGVCGVWPQALTTFFRRFKFTMSLSLGGTTGCPTSFLMSSTSKGQQAVLPVSRRRPFQKDNKLYYQFLDVVPVKGTIGFPASFLMLAMSKEQQTFLPVSWCWPCQKNNKLSYQFPDVPSKRTTGSPYSFLLSCPRDERLSLPIFLPSCLS
jgi:hypothetical protein